MSCLSYWTKNKLCTALCSKLEQHWPKVRHNEFVLYARVIANPWRWLRNEPVDKAYDQWLRNAIQNSGMTLAFSHHALVDNKVVWIENYPYASGTTRKTGPSKRACSRRTAIVVHDAVQEARVITKLKGVDESWLWRSHAYIESD